RHPVAEVVRTAEPLLHTFVDESLWEQVAQDDEHLRMLEMLHPRSGLTVPLVARDRVVGALEFLRADPSRPFTESDLALAVEVARRAAAADDNARLVQAAQQARQDREESLALLETVLATAPVGLAFLDRDKCFVRVNDVFAELSDRSASTHIGRKLSETMPALAEVIEPVLDGIIETGEPRLNLELDRQI